MEETMKESASDMRQSTRHRLSDRIARRLQREANRSGLASLTVGEATITLRRKPNKDYEIIVDKGQDWLSGPITYSGTPFCSFLFPVAAGEVHSMTRALDEESLRALAKSKDSLAAR